MSANVDVNLNTALNRHQSSLQEIHNEALDGMLVSGSGLLVSVAGMLLPLFGLITPWTMVAAGLIGTASLKDLVPGLMKLRRDRELAENTPIGILWSAREADDREKGARK